MEQLQQSAKQFAKQLLQDEIRVEAEAHPDLIYVQHEKPQVISVDDVRRQIGESVEVRPYEAAYKLYIIEEAEKLNVQAQNALLKTMEEPPEYVVILLLARNASVFLETILSRVVEFKAGEADASEQFAKIASEPWVKETIRMLSGAAFHSATDVLKYIKYLHEEKLEFRTVYSLMELLLRDVLAYKCTADVGRIRAQAAAGSIISMAKSMSYTALGTATDALEDAMRRQRFNVSEDLLMEDLLFQIAAAVQAG